MLSPEWTDLYEDNHKVINNNEFGFYNGVESSVLGDILKFSGTIRADKNENFDLNFSR